MTTLTLPVAEVLSFPVWLNETDEKRLTDSIPLQIELHGLQPRSQAPAVFDWSIVTREGTRTLVTIGILSASLPAEVNIDGYQAFGLSAQYLSFPENGLTLWLEQDRMVLAITSARTLVYFQALPHKQITVGTLQDLRCILSALSFQGILPVLKEITVWFNASSNEMESLQKELELPVRRADRPPPRPPSFRAWNLVPPAVSQARKAKETLRWRVRGILCALVIYLFLIGWFVAQFGLTTAKANELGKWKAAHATALDSVHTTQAAWKDLRSLVDEQDYPLESLLHVAQAIPEDQVHLTLFEAGQRHLLVKGEAKNAAAAFQFLDLLKKSTFFKPYTWEMAQPQLLPNDLAQFQIEATENAQDFE